MRQFLKGKKTYLTALIAILTALLAYVNGEIDTIKLVEAIFMAITAMTLRAGISKV